MSGSYDPDVHVPGLWRCARCGFVLVQSLLNAADGTVTANDAPGSRCPNDGSPMWRVTWQQQAGELSERCAEAVKEAADLRRGMAEVERAGDAMEEFLGRHVAWSVETFGKGVRTRLMLSRARREAHSVAMGAAELAGLLDTVRIGLEGIVKRRSDDGMGGG